MDARHSLGAGRDARTIITTRVFDAPKRRLRIDTLMR